ncbi:hypothetical protein ALC62_02120 [Cyphomyrmex costatus]|uniref:Uncharacterized protein n=1 Tax=Cyphomyrmex costatus TaxID=456900 RepID=A0A195D1U2_9HYME|nr:hypothetical protein ALC62_02120 [Cyphomyrmex costatus]
MKGEGGLRVFAASELNQGLFTNAPRLAGRPLYIGLSDAWSRPGPQSLISLRRNLSIGMSYDIFISRHMRKIRKCKVLIGPRPAGTTGFLARSLSSAREAPPYHPTHTELRRSPCSPPHH